MTKIEDMAWLTAITLDDLARTLSYLFGIREQNSRGHVPINAEHNREYSLKELVDMVTKYFEITRITGIKQGCIVHEDEQVGRNTFMVLRNSKT